MTRHQVLLCFPDTSQVLQSKINKRNLRILYQVLPGAGKLELRSGLSMNALCYRVTLENAICWIQVEYREKNFITLKRMAVWGMCTIVQPNSSPATENSVLA
jgi:hypothetical protein